MVSANIFSKSKSNRQSMVSEGSSDHPRESVGNSIRSSIATMASVMSKDNNKPHPCSVVNSSPKYDSNNEQQLKRDHPFVVATCKSGCESDDGKSKTPSKAHVCSIVSCLDDCKHGEERSETRSRNLLRRVESFTAERENTQPCTVENCLPDCTSHEDISEQRTIKLCLSDCDNEVCRSHLCTVESCSIGCISCCNSRSLENENLYENCPSDCESHADEIEFSKVENCCSNVEKFVDESHACTVEICPSDCNTDTDNISRNSEAETLNKRGLYECNDEMCSPNNVSNIPTTELCTDENCTLQCESFVNKTVSFCPSDCISHSNFIKEASHGVSKNSWKDLQTY
ncbi:CLUMA_CG001617, isoform A [Clunio marinus]|uniref:CLUMA_CG001617, isoform A n=1 Tax=Clunio marinus TaxID=568069 RepID=A0A1J1HIJ3_9DIPT|nr:CLUMA_CG001617, isoform A [Clunio marinus]